MVKPQAPIHLSRTKGKKLKHKHAKIPNIHISIITQKQFKNLISLYKNSDTLLTFIKIYEHLNSLNH